MKRKRKNKMGEFCVVHEDGRITDAELHEPILANEKADRYSREFVARRAVANGDMTTLEAEQAFGVKLGDGIPKP